MRPYKNLLTAVVFAAVACATGAASAQSTWSYASFTQNATNNGTYGNSYSQTQSGVKLTVSAYSTTGTGGTTQTANIANYGSGSGFGVRNQSEGLSVSSPQHGMDNYAHADFLALNFTDATTAAMVNMNVTQLATGWHNTSTSTGLNCNGSQANCVDSDISLLRWTGSSAPVITGKTLSGLLSDGWVLVNHYANMVDDTLRATGTSATSSWWLISAYNSAWGGNTSGLTGGDDFVKVLSSVTALKSNDTGGVPEPGTLLLAGLAMAGIAAKRRQMRQRG